MIVTFCGHKKWYGSTDEIAHLRTVICNMILNGADTFYLGGYGNFDSCVAGILRDLKHEFPHISLVLVIPYPDRDYNATLYDSTIYPPLEEVPLRFAIAKRNQWMVEQADILISGVRHDWGGAAATLEYAKRKKKHIISVFASEKELSSEQMKQ